MLFNSKNLEESSEEFSEELLTVAISATNAQLQKLDLKLRNSKC